MIDRIKTIISHYKLTDRAFALKCGIKQNTLSRQLSGVSDISMPTVLSVLEQFDDLSSEWLLKGRGEMLISDNAKKDASIERIERLVDTIATLQDAINEKTRTIQLYEEENRKLKGELTMLKNERNIG